MKRSWSLGTSSLAVAAALAAGSVAQAQTRTGESDKSTIEELVVTANKREERLQDVPQSITALTGQELQRQGVLEFSDYARRVPGLLFQDQGKTGPSRGSNVVIRGITTGLAQGFQAPTVAFYFDETPTPGFFAPNPVDLERIEILRGPQGTLYGAQSLGGAIKFIPRRPNLQEFGGEISGTYSRTDESADASRTLSGVLNIPLVKDRVGLRFVAGTQHLGGWIDNDRSDPLGLYRTPPRYPPAKDVNYTNVRSGRAELRALPSDRLTVDLLALYEQSGYHGAPQYDRAKPGFVQTGLFISDEGSENRTTLLNGRISYDLRFADLTWSSSRIRKTVDYVLDSGAVTRMLFDQLATGRAGSNFFRDPLRVEEGTKLRQTINEVRLSSKNEGALRWLGGVYYQVSKTQGTATGTLPGCSAFAALCNARDETFRNAFSNETDDKQLALFGEASLYLLDERLQLTGGGRWFSFKATSGAANAATGGNVLKTDISSHILKFAAAYRPDRDTLIFVQASQGFRNGSRNSPIPPPATQFRDLVEPDTLWNYELGLKKDWSPRLTTNLSLFYVDWKDIQLNVTSESRFIFTANAGKAHTKGVELEVTALPIDRLNLQLNVAWLEAQLDQTVATIGGAVKGARLPGTPEWTASGVAAYDWTLANGLTLTPRLDYQYRGTSFTGFGIISGVQLDAYQVVNGRLILARSGDWSASVFGENLLNEHPRVGINAFGAVLQYITIRPRTFGISARREF